jgi:hypothetical protein
MAWPADGVVDLTDPLPTDFMNGKDAAGAAKPGVDAVNLLNSQIALIRAIVAELGVNPSGAAPTVAARLAGLVDTVNGGVVTGSVTFTGGATLTLSADATADDEAMTLGQFNTRVAALYPGGPPTTTPVDGDTPVSQGPSTPWAWAPSGL